MSADAFRADQGDARESGLRFNRRVFALGAGAALAAVARPRAAFAQQAAAPSGPLTLPPLGYPFAALEPHIDALTMEIHHDKHHAGYVNAANVILSQHPDLAKKDVAAILSDLDAVPDAARAGLRNNLGGHYNHSLFWKLMAPGGAKAPTGDLKAAIEGGFGSLDAMQKIVNSAGMGRFGSGWAWVVLGKDKKLAVISTPNQDTPLAQGLTPVLGVDVWEHAYYLKHQNRRADYLAAWWAVVNWDAAAANFAKAQAG